MGIKQSTAFIRANGSVGTGYLVAEGLVVTCEHVVGGSEGNDVSVEFWSEIDGVTEVIGVKNIIADKLKDIAILELVKPVDRKPLEFAQRSRTGGVVDVFGYPKVAAGGAIWIKGELRDDEAIQETVNGIRRHPSLQIYSSEIHGESPQGLSGSPVFMEGKIVGHLRSIIPNKETPLPSAMFGVLYAVRVRDIADFLTEHFPEQFNIQTALISRTGPHVPFMVEELSEKFIPRLNEFGRLSGYLIDHKRKETIATTVVLRGTGGYGKTELAKAFCHNEIVQELFTDGILWVTLGEKPGDLTGRVEDLIYVLSDERPGFTTIEAATARLVELLTDRNILIVVDDVWNSAHLKPFVQGGSRCSRLITTRNLDTVPPNTQRVDVGAMEQDEAVALLVHGLLVDDADLLVALATKLGRWALLLRLVNGALQDRIFNAGQSLQDALAYINKALDKRGLTFFDARDAESREQAVSKTLSISFESLSSDERSRYGELAVFPEDTDIPLSTVERFWRHTGGIDEFDSEALCDRLYRLSLLLHYDPNTGRIRLHDVIRQYLLGEQELSLSELHNGLLEAHRRILPASVFPQLTAWADMPITESYLWENLAYHLIESKNVTELVHTVKDLRYLAIKTFLRKALATENDLLIAEKHAPDDAVLSLLRGLFAQSGHTLNRCVDLKDLSVTLHARLQYVGELSSLIHEFQKSLSRPYLMARHRLPDVPHPALIRTLAGHTSWVTSCAISRADSVVVSTSLDNSVKIWDVNRLTEPKTLVGHTEPVGDCAISSDGSFVVSASKDKTLKIWDVETGKERNTLCKHTGAVNKCAISFDGTFIVSASSDNTLIIWDAETGKERFILLGHTKEVGGVAISPDDSFIVSASDDGTLIVWEPNSGRKKFTLVGHADDRRVRDCVISLDGSFIVSASSDATLIIWDAQTGQRRASLWGHWDQVTSCAISSDNSFIVSASFDGTVRVWEAESGDERFTLQAHSPFLYACAISPDNKLIVADSGDGIILVWDSQSGDELFALSGHTHNIRNCVFSSDGSFLVSTSSDQTLKVWDMKNGKRYSKQEHHASFVNICSVSPDGSTIVYGRRDRLIEAWDANTGVKLNAFVGYEGTLHSCAVSPDMAFIVACSYAKNVNLTVWDTVSGIERFTLSSLAGGDWAIGSSGSLLVFFSDYDNTPTLWEVGMAKGARIPIFGQTSSSDDFAISKDSDLIIGRSADGSMEVWETKTGNSIGNLVGHKINELAGHTGGVKSCAISNDCSFIVSASKDKTLKVWDADSGSERFTLAGHESDVTRCIISSDDAKIISSSYDGTLKVWSVSDGKELFTLTGHKGTIEDFAVSPNSQFLITVSSDQTLKVWELGDGKCLSTLNTNGELRVCNWFPDNKNIVAGGLGGVYFLQLVW